MASETKTVLIEKMDRASINEIEKWIKEMKRSLAIEFVNAKRISVMDLFLKKKREQITDREFQEKFHDCMDAFMGKPIMKFSPSTPKADAKTYAINRQCMSKPAQRRLHRLIESVSPPDEETDISSAIKGMLDILIKHTKKDFFFRAPMEEIRREASEFEFRMFKDGLYVSVMRIDREGFGNPCRINGKSIRIERMFISTATLGFGAGYIDFGGDRGSFDDHNVRCFIGAGFTGDPVCRLHGDGTIIKD